MDKKNASGIMKDFAATSLFAAIIFLMAFTPLGFINLVMIKATIVHVPVIIGSVLLGPKIGALLGVFFGLSSIINNTVSPALLSFAFSPLIPVPGTGKGSIWALLICFGPRILVGVVPYYVSRIMTALAGDNGKRRLAPFFAAGVSGAMTNTVLVMGLIYLVFRDAYAAARGVDSNAVLGMIMGVVGMHGIPEAVVAGVFTSAVCRAMMGYRRKGTPGQNGEQE